MILGKSQVVFTLALLCAAFLSVPHMAVGQPATGSYLPPLKMQAPQQEKDRQYLGVDNNKVFTTDQVDSPFTLIEDRRRLLPLLSCPGAVVQRAVQQDQERPPDECQDKDDCNRGRCNANGG